MTRDHASPSRCSGSSCLCDARPRLRTYGDIAFEDVRWEGHGQAPRYFTPIFLSNSDRLHGFSGLRNNSRRPIGDDYYQFMSDLQRHATAATSITATTRIEEAIKRNQRLQDQIRLVGEVSDRSGIYGSAL